MVRLDLRRALQMHGRLTLAFVLGGLVAALAYSVHKWPTYVAQSQVYIQPGNPQLLSQNPGATWPSDSNSYDSFIQQKVQSAANPTVLLLALHKLPAGSWQKPGENDYSAALRLGKSVQTKRLGSSYQISITAQSHQAALSAQMANAIAGAVIDNAANEARSGNNERIAALQKEQQRIDKQLADDRSVQDQINAQLGIAAVGPSTPDHFDEEVGQLREELVKARTAREDAAAHLNSIAPAHDSDPSALNAEADEQVAADAGLVSMKTALNQRRAQLIAQMANLTPSHPLYKQDTDELAHIDSSLEATSRDLRSRAAQRIRQRLRSNLNRATALEEQLNAQLIRMSGAAAGATSEMQRASDLVNNIAHLQNRSSAVDEQLHNLMLDANAPGAAHLSSAATVPPHPDPMAVLRVALPLIIGSLLLGLLAALLAFNLDSRIYVAADIERILGLAPMAELPDFAEVSDGVADEHLLRLVSAIDHACQSGTLRNCLFTACCPESGVSTLTARIKELFTQMGRPVQLVNASGSPAPLYNAGSSTDAQANALSVIPVTSHSSALLAKVAEHSSESDKRLLLTDTAPLTLSAETEYLARYVDATIIVVASGLATESQLRQLAASLARLNVGAIGIVLNRISLANAEPAFRRAIALMEKRLQNQERLIPRASDRDWPSELISQLATRPSTQAAEAAAAASEPEPEPERRPRPTATGPVVRLTPEEKIELLRRAASFHPSAPHPAEESFVSHPAPTAPAEHATPPASVVTPQPAASPVPGAPLAPLSVPTQPAVATPPPEAALRPIVAAEPVPAAPVAAASPEPVAIASTEHTTAAEDSSSTEQSPAAAPAGTALETAPGAIESDLPAEREVPAPHRSTAKRNPSADAERTSTASRLSGLRRLAAEMRRRQPAPAAPTHPEPFVAPPLSPEPEPLPVARRAAAPAARTFDEPLSAPPPFVPEPEPASNPVPAPRPPAQQAPPAIKQPAEAVKQTPAPQPATLKAKPEILPPQSSRDEAENQHKTNFDRRPAYDDVDILPSWRGQYKKS